MSFGPRPGEHDWELRVQSGYPVRYGGFRDRCRSCGSMRSKNNGKRVYFPADADWRTPFTDTAPVCLVAQSVPSARSSPGGSAARRPAAKGHTRPDPAVRSSKGHTGKPQHQVEYDSLVRQVRGISKTGPARKGRSARRSKSLKRSRKGHRA